VSCDKSGNDLLVSNAGPGVDNNNIEARLRALHDEYAAAVNVAIDEGRDELVDSLADEFSEVALELMLDKVLAA
jgi:hypothetical protein